MSSLLPPVLGSLVVVAEVLVAVESSLVLDVEIVEVTWLVVEGETPMVVITVGVPIYLLSVRAASTRRRLEGKQRAGRIWVANLERTGHSVARCS